jgi:hypothetical protein
MAKSSGITTTVNVDDSGGVARNLSNDITSINISTPRGVQDITGLDKSAIERLLLLADGSVTISGVFNPTATTSAHAVFKTVPSTSVARTVTVLYNTTPTATLAMEILFTDYAVSRSQSGELTFSAPGVLADGTVPTWT